MKIQAFNAALLFVIGGAVSYAINYGGNGDIEKENLALWVALALCVIAITLSMIQYGLERWRKS